MSDLEDRMGLRSLDTLLAARADLVQQVAELRAQHAAFGTYGDLRKIELAKLAWIIRTKAVGTGTKMTEAAIDEAAHTSPTYIEFVTDATREKARWVRLEDQIQAINDTIMRENAIARFLASEAMLAR